MKKIILSFLFIFILKNVTFGDTLISTWNGPGGGNWNVAGNWTSIPSPGFPNGINSVAILKNIAAPSAISLNGTDITLANITLDVAQIFTINNNTLIFSSTGPGNPSIDSNTTVGQLVINSDIIIAYPTLNLHFSPFVDILYLNGSISGASNGINVATGSIVLQGTTSNTYTGLTTLTDGGLTLNKTSPAIAIQGDIDVDGGNLFTSEINQFAVTSNINMNGGTFDLADKNQTINGLSGTSNISLGTATLTVAEGTYSGVISETGGLTKISSGTLTLSGLNTYSGITSINAGTLQIGIDEALGSGNISFNGGTLSSSGSHSLSNNITLDNTGIVDTTIPNTITLSGSISGANGLTKTGTGTLILSNGGNSYSGTTTISNGILQTAADKVLGGNSSISACVLNGTLDLYSHSQDIGSLTGSGAITSTIAGTPTLTVGYNNSSPAAYSGTIENGSATLSLTKTGTGTLILSNGANSYSGGTAINGGTITINADNNLGTGDISFDGGTLTSSNIISTVKAVTLNASGGTFDVASDTLTLTSSITGAGALTKTGAGTLTFSGSDKNYSGNTAINDGIFISNSNIPNSDVTVANAEIKGNFTAKSLTTNAGGFVRPGNSIGTIYVTDLTLNSDSTYEVEINQTSSDRIIASNSASINPGAILEVLPLTTALIPEHRYEIITVTGINPVSGTFTNIIFDNPSVTGSIFYNLGGNNVILELTPGSLQNTVTGGNPGAVAAYIDSLPSPFGSALQNIIDILVVMPEDQMRQALDQLHPAIFKGFALSQHNILNIRKIIQEKSNEFYQNCCIRNIPCKKKISVWATPYGSFLSQQDYTSGDFYYMGFNTDSIGIVIGSDFMIKRNCYLGLSGAYSYSDIRWHDKRGKGDISSYYGNIYTSYHTNIFFINSSLFGAYNHFEGHRNIRFSSIDRTAHNKHSGGEFLAHLDTGYICHFKNSFELKPFVSGDYLYLKENSFTEKGAGILNLHVQKSNYNTYRFEAGTYAGACFMYCRDKVIPDIKLSYIREINDTGRYYTCNFVEEPGSFKAKGPRPKRNIFSPGASVTMLYCNDRGKLSIRYDGEFAKNYSNNVVNLEFGYQF